MGTHSFLKILYCKGEVQNRLFQIFVVYLLRVVAAVDVVVGVVAVVAAGNGLTTTPDCCAFALAAWSSRTMVLCLTML